MRSRSSAVEWPSGARGRPNLEVGKAPYSSVGLLVNGQTGTATTAWLVAPDIILTAGHCLCRPGPAPFTLPRNIRGLKGVGGAESSRPPPCGAFGGAQLWQARSQDLRCNRLGAQLSAHMSEGCSGWPITTSSSRAASHSLMAWDSWSSPRHGSVGSPVRPATAPDTGRWNSGRTQQA